ncbi:hypothetical protein ACFL47_06700 [Candidatus Latescibacterota bacterium]
MALLVLYAVAGFADETPANIDGTWSITLKFIAGEGHHTAVITQKDSTVTGDYRGEFKKGMLRGKVTGNLVNFTGFLRHEATGVRFSYKGTADGDTMKGTVDMGEYWTATYTARRVKK